MYPALARMTLVLVTTDGRRLRPRAGVELALLALLYVGYSAARLLADGDVSRAVGNAHDLLHLESVLHLDVERSANHLLTGVPGLALVASYWYSALHYLVTPAVLVWVYRRHALRRDAAVRAPHRGRAGRDDGRRRRRRDRNHRRADDESACSRAHNRCLPVLELHSNRHPRPPLRLGPAECVRGPASATVQVAAVRAT